MTERCVLIRTGEAALYIPSGVPHLVANASDSRPAVTVLARSDPNEQESVTELPELDALPHLRTERPA
jgi:uncharacterized RmlC-like cupin family protein